MYSPAIPSCLQKVPRLSGHCSHEVWLCVRLSFQTGRLLQRPAAASAVLKAGDKHILPCWQCIGCIVCRLQGVWVYAGCSNDLCAGHKTSCRLLTLQGFSAGYHLHHTLDQWSILCLQQSSQPSAVVCLGCHAGVLCACKMQAYSSLPPVVLYVCRCKIQVCTSLPPAVYCL